MNTEHMAASPDTFPFHEHWQTTDDHGVVRRITSMDGAILLEDSRPGAKPLSPYVLSQPMLITPNPVDIGSGQEVTDAELQEMQDTLLSSSLLRLMESE